MPINGQVQRNMLSDVVLVSPSVTAYALCCVFVAAVARGFSGFGFTLLAIMSLSFVLPLATIVPAMFVLEIAAGLRLLPSLWGQVHWRSIRVLVMGFGEQRNRKCTVSAPKSASFPSALCCPH